MGSGLFTKRRSSAKSTSISSNSYTSNTSNTTNAPKTPKTALSDHEDKTPKGLEQSMTRTVTYSDINFDHEAIDDLECIVDDIHPKLPNDDMMTKLMDDPILKEEDEDDDDEFTDDEQYDYYSNTDGD